MDWNKMILDVIPKIEQVISRIMEINLPVKLLALLLAFIAPLHFLVGVVMFFVTLDTLSGIYKTYMRNKRLCKNKKASLTNLQILTRSYSKEKFEKTITKVFSYPLILLAFYVFDNLVLGIEMPEGRWLLSFSFTNYMFILIATMDLISFFGNMGEATDLHIWNIARKILVKKVNEKTENEFNFE